MDLQFWIWIIVIVVSLIARAMKKKPAEEIPAERPSNRLNSPQPEFNQKPLTFEELLREIQTSKAPATPAYPTTTAAAEYVDYDDELENEEEDLEKTDYTYRNEDATYAAYEKAKQEAFIKPSLEETMKLSDTDMKFGHFKGYQQVEQWVPTTNYAAEFQDPESFKRSLHYERDIEAEVLNVIF